jgi:hypothetical protein
MSPVMGLNESNILNADYTASFYTIAGNEGRSNMASNAIVRLAGSTRNCSHSRIRQDHLFIRMTINDVKTHKKQSKVTVQIRQ